jgi:SAM-dependent methyltransferase
MAKINSGGTLSRGRDCIGRLALWIVVHTLQAIEALAVRLANLGRPEPALCRQFSLADILKAHRMSRRMRDGDAVLDIGCGNGHVLEEVGLFKELARTGIELAPRETQDSVPERLLPRAARDGVALRSFDGWMVPFPDRSFDVVLVCYVLHHLTRDHAAHLFGEALRVARRAILIVEDTLPSFGWLYRMRNWVHRHCTEIEYSAESQKYRPTGGDSMFLTQNEWQRFLEHFPRVDGVAIEPLGNICRYAHHTLIDVTCSGS